MGKNSKRKDKIPTFSKTNKSLSRHSRIRAFQRFDIEDEIPSTEQLRVYLRSGLANIIPSARFKNRSIVFYGKAVFIVDKKITTIISCWKRREKNGEKKYAVG